jgi:outer membrane lipoprotein-sorting protein
MTKPGIISILLLTISSQLSGQTDLEANKILDSFSSKALSAPSVSMKFKLITIDQMENTSNTIDGSIVLYKDKYKLILPDNTTWFNGSNSWNYLKNEKEVTITKPKTGDDTFLSKPSSIFTMYKKGYKTKLISENSNQSVIDMYPEDIKSDLVRIRLTITKPGMELKNAEYKTRNGLLITLDVNDYDLETKYEPSFFSFNSTEFDDVELVDLR